MQGIIDSLLEKIDNWFGKILYYIERVICKFISWLEQLFNVFSGITPAKYNGQDDYLINVFFGNKVINGVFTGMAAIGIVMAGIFLIIAIVRKNFDLDDKERRSHGQIIRGFLRSMLFIICLSLFMTISVTFTSVLMDAVDNVFDYAYAAENGSSHIDFTEEQFAAMGRIMNTVGNYSVNQSYNSRYNLNACYNEIRSDLKYLADEGVFNYNYKTSDDDDDTWQSLIEDIANAADYNSEQPVDVYNESIANSLTACMKAIKTNSNLYALESFDREDNYNTSEANIDRILFISGTMGSGNTAAARNEAYNKNPSMTDNVRLPYYNGEKSIYDLDQVNEDFYVNVSRTNYFVLYVVGAAIIVNMVMIVVSCVVRIFNLLFLYVIGPPIIAVYPLDGGAKFKQWLTSFIVQAFSIFASVISMRIFLIFVPIVMSSNLQLSDNSTLNMIGKLLLVWGAVIAIRKANGLLTGILSDNAGMQSIMAGSVETDVKSSALGRFAGGAKHKAESAAVGAVTGTASWAAGKAKSIVGGTLGTVGRAAALPFRPAVGAVKNTFSRASDKLSQTETKMSNKWVESNDYKKHKQEQAESAQAKADRAEERSFRQRIGGYFEDKGNNRNSQNIEPPPQRKQQNAPLPQKDQTQKQQEIRNELPDNDILY